MSELPSVDDLLSLDVVYRLEWESGGPAGGGVECVHKRGNHYVVLTTYDDPAGPFEDLLSAIQSSELEWITGATTRVRCSELDIRKLLELFWTDETEKFRLEVNGHLVETRGDGKFQLVA